jgi:hypothetical protein
LPSRDTKVGNSGFHTKCIPLFAFCMSQRRGTSRVLPRIAIIGSKADPILTTPVRVGRCSGAEVPRDPQKRVGGATRPSSRENHGVFRPASSRRQQVKA